MKGVAAGVSMSTIRAYERRSKDINKAQANILRCLTKTLGCSIEEHLDESFYCDKMSTSKKLLTH